MPPCSGGPSGNTWPRWPPHLLQSTSVRIIPCETSRRSSTASPSTGPVKAGQPQPLLYLESLSNGISPHPRSEEHTSELQSLMRISYAVFCLKKKKNKYT